MVNLLSVENLWIKIGSTWRIAIEKNKGMIAMVTGLNHTVNALSQAVLFFVLEPQVSTFCMECTVGVDVERKQRSPRFIPEFLTSSRG